MKNNLSEMEIKNLVRTEIAECFNEMSKDIAILKNSNVKLEHGIERIERLLIGDKDLADIGYAEMIKYSYDYTKRNVDRKIIERGEKAISHFEIWDHEGKWKIINEMIEKYSAVKWLTYLIVSSGIISVANVITMILKLIQPTI